MSCPITMRGLENVDPFPAYEALRAQGSVVWDESLKGWLVLDFDLCRHVELNEQTQFRNMYADADPLVVELKGGAANITVSQGEQHLRMRRFHMSLLSPKALQSYRDNIVTPIIQNTLDRVLAKVSSYYDKEVEVSLKATTSLIEPLMICVMGVVVGGIALGLLLPIFQLSRPG